MGIQAAIPTEICKSQEKNHHRAHREHSEILLIFLSVFSVSSVVIFSE
ncbi:hypothetical protein SCG7086_AT_00030 [Chlamydiales bacterium SCGC AG-110-P3]|nr:hypothetical protein SCG7086_AT_00030 [Chlamydiales bacterium SCGC AG-110-P3]